MQEHEAENQNKYAQFSNMEKDRSYLFLTSSLLTSKAQIKQAKKTEFSETLQNAIGILQSLDSSGLERHVSINSH